ncbi:purine-cytosine permease family protein [Ruicaihuangia caeni]|uniref:Cytosine permease n=1 Tax=Ruicaihuangia caeni TaxID=3042517 RepID=A0AAW6T8Z3_9MICO|nr:cytosine permease [Klugiella sp. YN-L-19]MDI2098809.1 cytosine permease [Klugiella sp. YN-L-19]
MNEPLPNAGAIQRRGIEVRSIDYVPLRERHGKVWHQGPFWFTSNFGLLTLAAGFIGPAMGLGFGWSFVAIVLGSLFGTFFMAFHANQGPTLGLPQMIQSRAQFGLRGAVIPIAAGLFVYIGLNVFDTIAATDAFLALGAGGDRTLWYVGIVLVQVVIAIFGYDIIHVVQRWLTWILIPLFAVLTVGAIIILGGGEILTMGDFAWVPFLTVFGAVSGFLLGYAIYVSDYTRYLPPDTRTGPLVFWTYLGAAGSSIWMIGLGALLASALTDGASINSILEVGDDVFPGLGWITLLVGGVALVTVMAVNTYGATLVGISAIDAFKTVPPTRTTRVIAVLVVSAIVLGLALALPEDFLGSFSVFLTLLLYFLVPWTAVNLVDYYFVRRGRYSVLDIFDPRGIYGSWSWRGMVAYLLGFASMIPFFSTIVYTGPIAQALGGADISVVVGLPVAAISYWLLSRSIDLDAEEQARRDSFATLEPDADPRAMH